MSGNVTLKCPVCAHEEHWPRASMGILPPEVSRIESPCDRCEGEGERYFDAAGRELFLGWGFGTVEIIQIAEPNHDHPYTGGQHGRE